MKAAILYATRTGTAKKCAEYLCKALGTADLFDLKTDRCDLSKYDTVIIGGGVRIGRVPKPAAKFLAQNKEALLQKKLGLFLCAGFTDEENGKKQLEQNFPTELLRHACAVACFGGEICMDRLKGLDKMMVNMIAKSGGGLADVTIDYAAADRFAQQLSE